MYVSQALTTTRMEFEALEDEANAIHGDLWEQLNAGVQVRRYTVYLSLQPSFKLYGKWKACFQKNIWNLQLHNKRLVSQQSAIHPLLI